MSNQNLEALLEKALADFSEGLPKELQDSLATHIEQAKVKRDQIGQKAETTQGDADIALIGMAVMGQNLILNMADKGFKVVAWNRTSAKVEEFVQTGAAKGHANVVGATSTEDMCKKLKHPRKIVIMVKAGQPVDDMIETLLPYLSKGDIIIDGGNSHFPDSIRRTKSLASKGLLFVGAGVSGGEEGARHGPSIMPGGAKEAWPSVKPIFQAICAKSDDEPCCDWVGEDGAGHYVKMVHNGIEYGDMQVICEAYHLMRDYLGLTPDEMAAKFDAWNKGELESYLIEITADILKYKDTDGSPLVEKIRDTAGQKGTGKWTGIEALDLGVPLTLIGESVFSRCLSALKDERVAASKEISAKATRAFSGDKDAFVEKIGKALLASKIVSYAQGFMLLRSAAKEHGWNLNYGAVALMWRGGCIIRSSFLHRIKEAYTQDPGLNSLLLNTWFKDTVANCESAWRDVVSEAAHAGVPLPTLSTALNFWDGYRTARLPANLLQAQRDYFGAHTYELLEKPGEFVHTNWTGKGGNVSSSTYNK